jgi:hypothetical protein
MLGNEHEVVDCASIGVVTSQIPDAGGAVPVGSGVDFFLGVKPPFILPCAALAIAATEGAEMNTTLTLIDLAGSIALQRVVSALRRPAPCRAERRPAVTAG